MPSSGLTVTCNDADFVGSLTEVAVTVAVIVLETEAGVLYVAALVVWLDSVPPPDTPHVTPALFGSFDTVAVTLTVCPWSIVCVALGDKLTTIGAGLDEEPPPQPASKETETTAKSAAT
jgi:hypothetical protein